MDTIKKSTTSCKTNNLLKYFDFLCKAKHVADPVGLELLENELRRIKSNVECIRLGEKIQE